MFCEAKAPEDTKVEFCFFCLYTSVYSRNLKIVKGGRDKAGFRFPGHPYFCYHTNAIPEKDPKHTTPKEKEMGNQIRPSSGLTAPMSSSTHLFILSSIQSAP